MPTFRDIVGKGYLPRELPPCFSTANYASTVSDANGAASGNYLAHLQNDTRELSVHNMVRSGGLRRNLSIPNPVPYAKMAAYVASNWATISTAAHRSPFSLTKPVDNIPGRAISPEHNLDGRVLKRIELRANARVIIKTDINRFYPSIYTHSLPWAVHSKAAAKAAKASGQINTLWADKLDGFLMGMNSRQTMGIPIGPDLSLVMAEIVLGAVDHELATKYPDLQAIRYIDDYEIALHSRSQAEKIISDLQSILSQYELALNPSKTRIIDLPDELEPLWASRLRIFNFRDAGTKGERNDLTAYFDTVFTLAKAEPEEAIFKYAIPRLNSLDIKEENWSVYERILSQCTAIEPACLNNVCEQLIHYKGIGRTINKAMWFSTLNQVISSRLPLGQASEALWALWALKILEIPMTIESHTAIDNSEDSAVAVMGLGLTTCGLSLGSGFPQLELFIEPTELKSRHWLLCYEANHQGWLSPRSGANPWSTISDFAYLNSKGVSFFDINAAPPTPRRNVYTSGSWGGGGGSPD